MASRITPDKIEEINELYYEIGVKSKVAKIVGVSASTVSKYIQSDYIPKSKRIVNKTAFVPSGIEEFNKNFEEDKTFQFLYEARLLDAEEWEEIIKMQQTEIFE